MTTDLKKSIHHPQRWWYFRAYRCSAMISMVLMIVAMFPVRTNGNSLILTGENCAVKEPLYNITFNLSALNSDLAHHATSDINERFIFDVCDQLDIKCNGVTGGAACLRRKDGTEVQLGRKSTLQLVDGRIHFNFTGGEPCQKGRNYSFDIILMCSYTMEPESMSVVPYSSDQCNYFMFWSTKLACAPLPDIVKNNECSVKDATGYVFNFLPLSHVNHHVPDRNGSHFFVTACKPVHYGHMTMCPLGSSVCYVNKTEDDYTRKYHDYGQTDPNPTIEQGKLVMNFKSKEGTCQNSKILFECDPAATEEVPEYVGMEGCTHLFSWRTSFACKKTEPCSVVDPISGLVFNMTSLAKQTYTVKQGEATYEFGICDMTKSRCPDQSGACQIASDNSQAVSLGTINDKLLYNITGAPYLRYTSGSICDHSNSKWSTRIEFICQTDKGEKLPPKLVENAGCEVIIQIETELACTRDISCSAMNFSSDREVDLSPLISADHNYEALVNSSLQQVANKRQKFYLNVCRPLLSTFGLGCPGGSAACLAVQGPSDLTPTSELSLGYPDVSLTIVGERAQLRYLRGDDCPQDNATKLSTEIEFYCAPEAGRGNPILQEILHDCHYRFEWPTNVVCPSTKADFTSSDCVIFNGQTKTKVDLRDIFANGALIVDPSPKSKSEELKDGKVLLCSKNISAVVDYSKQAVKMFFTVTDALCEGTGGTVNVNLRVNCADEQSFSMNEQSACHLILTQQTPKICAFVGASSRTGGNDDKDHSTEHNLSSTPETKTSTQTESSSSMNDNSAEVSGSPGSALGIILAALTLVSLTGAAALLLWRNPARRECVRSLFGRRNVSVQYSRVSNEEANLLMHTPGTISDSDDELLI
ncbi:cation-independent mannose-6-phosphate receptor [Malaya genurostris]|uniref:cation-independent mannose-6-phosphate receptor n=1 Tax=Malaya genurostris TaxID=325434 RepID=UPI0026F38A95|nr:cation-independent mannose-6-phosphate receptor [Malaya genurostris]